MSFSPKYLPYLHPLVQILCLREPEVSDFIYFIMDHYIVGFEVPVDDIELFQVHKPLTDLEENILRLCLRDPLTIAILPQELSQIPSIAVFDDQVAIPWFLHNSQSRYLNRLVHLYDVGVLHVLKEV